MKVKGKKVAVGQEFIVILDAGMAPTGPVICCTGFYAIYR